MNVYRCKAVLKYALLGVCTLIAVFLAYYSTCSSVRQQQIPYGVTLLETCDSLILHLIVAAEFLIIMQTIHSNSNICGKNKTGIYLGVVMLFTTLCCLVWVAAGNFFAQNDSWFVLNCMEHMRNGDFSDLHPKGYLGMYKQHFGLITLFRFLFFVSGTTDEIAVQFFNCLCVPVIIYAGIQILKELKVAKSSLIVYLIFMTFCLPLFLYTPYVYGEIISVTAGMVFIWAAICYLKRGRAGAWVALAVSAVIGNMARGNFPVLLIAFTIMAFLYSVRRKKVKYVLCALSMFAAIVVANKLNIIYYEHISGIALDQGIPMEAWIAMGLDEYGELGYGTYSGYGPQLYVGSGCDRELTRSRAGQFIRDRMNMFKTGAGMSAKDFYMGKILLQWNDPTLNCFMENHSFRSQPYHLFSDIVQEEGKYADWVKEIMNQYQFLVYAGFLLYCVSLWKDDGPFYQYLPLIILLGGVLFTILWEAMSRYVFPYMVYMIPLAARGWDSAGEWTERVKRALGSRRTVDGDRG